MKTKANFIYKPSSYQMRRRNGNTEITLTFDSEKMRALTLCLKMENTTVQEKLDEAMRQLYEKSVPDPVREFLDISSAPQRPKHPPRSRQPKPSTPKVPPAPVEENSTRKSD